MRRVAGEAGQREEAPLSCATWRALDETGRPPPRLEANSSRPCAGAEGSGATVTAAFGSAAQPTAYRSVGAGAEARDKPTSPRVPRSLDGYSLPTQEPRLRLSDSPRLLRANQPRPRSAGAGAEGCGSLR